MPSDRPPVVLMHPFLLSANVWDAVVPLLTAYHEVFTPTALGHRGGPPVQRRPARIWDVIDAAEEYLDQHGLERPHLAGNSMGGFVALELARRGRAATVCAFSPAGFWASGDGSRARADRKVRRIATMSRLSRPLAPVIFQSGTVRRLSFRFLNSACHAERLSEVQAIAAAKDVVACTVTDEVLAADDEQVAPLDPLPCPVTIAWGQKDSLFPVAEYGRFARDRLPRANFEILPGVNHVPMMDDPGLVARTILAVTGAAMPQS